MRNSIYPFFCSGLHSARIRSIANRRFFATALSLAMFFSQTALAETLDFGGVNEKYKGSGDKTPPQCQITYPTGSTEPFFLKWYCVDDIADTLDIKSEVWIYRKGSPVGQLLTSFLGFPASVKVDEALLQVTNFTDGLPVSFRLVATDRSGNSTMTQLLTVNAQDNAVSTCDISITAAASESTGDTTGLPEQKATLVESAVNFSQTNASNLSVSNKAKETSKTCQIDSICAEDSQFSYAAKLAFESGSTETISGEVTVSPGGLTVSVDGTATVNNQQLESLEVSGTATFEGRDTTVNLTCSKN